MARTSTLSSVIDRFPSPPDSARGRYYITRPDSPPPPPPTSDQLLDLLLQKVQTDVLDAYNTLDLTEDASAKLDAMIGDLSRCDGEKAMRKQVGVNLGFRTLDFGSQNFQCYAIFNHALSSPFKE